jgi:Secretion system C-terminal sorting domain
MKKSTLQLFYLLGFLVMKTITFAQTPSLVFAHSLETNHEHGIWSRATVSDSEGNFYITGLYHGTVDFDTSDSGTFLLTYQGGTENVIDGEADVYVVKYNAQGEFIWAKNLLEPTFVNMNEERASSMIIDNTNLYITGFTSTRGFFVSKWDISGTELWTRYFDDLEENSISTFALKKLNNSILVSGLFAGTVDFDPSATVTNNVTAFNGDGFLLSLSSDGIFDWVKQFRCNGFVLPTGLEVDDANNIFLSGIFLGSVDVNPSPTASTIITSNSVSTGAISSAFIAKYSSTGELIWNRHVRGTAPTDIFMTFIKKDSNNNILMTGSFKGVSTFLPTSTVINSNDSYTSFLAQYDANGNLNWAKQFGIPTGNQTSFFTGSFAANLLLDECDNIYISGEFHGNCDFDPSSNEKVLQTLTNTIDVFIVKYSPNGTHIWSMDIGNTGNPAFVDFNGYLPITLTDENDLIITGTFRGSFDMDPTDGTSLLNSNASLPNNAGLFIAKYQNPVSCNLTIYSNESVQFEIAPNPAKESVTIQAKASNLPFEISILDALGKLVYQSELVPTNEITLQLPSLTKGVYIIKINSESGTHQQKLFIE